MKLLWRFLAIGVVGVSLVPVSAFATTAPSTPKPTCVMTLNASTINVGESVTLKWTSTNATAGTITSVGAVAPQGQVNLLPSNNAQTTFVGTFTGPGGTGQCSATVNVVHGTAGVTDTGTGVDSGTVTTGTNGQGPQIQLGTQTTPTPTQTFDWQGQPLTPSNTSASPSTGSLVTCGNLPSNKFTDAASYATFATSCQACNLAELVQNIINFAIGLSIPIVAGLFAWAGVLYFTSAEKPSNITHAKEIFANAFIGFVIVLTGWLIINTLLHAILRDNLFPQNNWFTVECVNFNSRARTDSIDTLLSVLPGLRTSTPGGNSLGVGGTGDTSGGSYSSTNNDTGAYLGNASAGPSGTCAKGQQYQEGDLGGVCYDASTGVSVDATPYKTGDIAAAAAAYRGSLTNTGPDNGNLACAWAVNNVLRSAGVDPLDTNSVYGVEQALQSRGTPVDASSAQAGDIVVWKTATVSHVGICYDPNGGTSCNEVLSNSSSRAIFDGISGTTMRGVQGRIYHVNN